MEHRRLSLYKPAFDSSLSTLILELEHLRRKQLAPSTHPLVFLQLKKLFHTLESVGSARIEGNNTTLAEYLENQEEETPRGQQGENFKEIKNIEEALAYIDDCGTDHPIDTQFVRELHQLVVRDLSTDRKGEGDRNAGQYRKHAVRIAGSAHTPPDALLVEEYMVDLLNFINHDAPPQFDLIKIAQAHHRFVWIHPFGNGNGRTVRLFTYAMLIRAGFRVHIAGRIVNPTAIFCSDRDEYYHYLSLADNGTPEGMYAWCHYVLAGLLDEIKKVDQLCNYDYLRDKILYPAIEDAYTNGRISLDLYKILRIVAKEQVIMSGSLREVYPDQAPATISRKTNAFVRDHFLMPETANGRKYVLSFANPQMMPSITKALAAEGFLPSNI